MKNPNRVRSLVGAFAGNHLRFHAADGSRLCAGRRDDPQLDAINPQVAARMAGAFEAWRRYDPKRQALMRGELEAMLKIEGLSPNLFEVAAKNARMRMTSDASSWRRQIVRVVSILHRRSRRQSAFSAASFFTIPRSSCQILNWQTSLFFGTVP